MTPKTISTAKAQLTEAVQDGLNHLYDTPYLQNHPLTAVSGGSNATGLDVRRILVEAIRAMRPGIGIPAQSPDWRMYRILELRYLEGLSPQEVMDRISLAKSQYYREQSRIVEMTAEWLWEQYGDDWRVTIDEEAMEVEALDSRATLAKAEVEHLCASADWREVNVGHLLVEVLMLLQPLAFESGVTIKADEVDTLILPHADRTLLRQVLLHIMTLSLEAAQTGTISIGSIDQAESFGLQVHALPAPSAESCNSGPTYPEREGIGLEISQKMIEAMGGSLSVSAYGNGGWIAHLLWPVKSAHVLLVIDDNKHFHDLFQRYLSGYSWQVMGSTSITKGREILAEMHPKLILLDIMMPKEDGWQLLHALRASEETRDIPVIICSVLNQPHLARSLGASGYLRKPVTQQALLQALSPWLAESSILQQE